MTDPVDVLNERIDEAIDLAVKYGGIDGAHHKQWVIDQMVRALAGDKYDSIVAEACAGDDGPDTYDWDTGTPPSPGFVPGVWRRLRVHMTDRNR